ncbi:MAG: hypothetical protein ACXVQY_00670 [Actinomycetota bacterium]
MAVEQDPVDIGVVVQEIVYAGLEALKAAVPLDLCAYLHAAADQGPQLFLGSPDLASIDPSEAFSLFSALRDALGDTHEGDETMLLGGYLAVAVSSEGPHSRGLHVVGRRETPFEETERATIARLARSVAAIVHRVERPQRPPLPPDAAGSPIRVAVETLQDRARAEVSAPFGDEIRTGTGEATTASRAVALAVIDAVDASLKLRDAVDGEVGGERAVLVLLSDQRENLAVAAALVEQHGGDTLRATAAAALDAAQRLPSL